MDAHDAILLAIVGLLTAVVGSPVFIAIMTERNRKTLEVRDNLSREQMTREIIGEMRRIETMLAHYREEVTKPIPFHRDD